MSISARFVSWPELVAAFQAHPDEPDFLFRAQDNQEPWVTYASVYDDSPRTAYDASRAYEKLRRRLTPDDREKLDRLFGAFFWWNEAAHRNTPVYVQDLSEQADGEAFAVTMRPETVREYLALWDEAAFEQMRGPSRRSFPRSIERMKSFDAFKEYVGMWIGLLQGAVERDRGLVVSIFGT
jgi:hypothetical protein